MEQLRSSLGHGNTDTLRLAIKESAPVISHDHFWRVFLHDQRNIPGACLLGLSIFMKAKDLQTIDAHNAFVARLLLNGYEKVPVDSDVLVACIELDGFHFGKATQGVADEFAEIGTDSFVYLFRGIGILSKKIALSSDQKRDLCTGILERLNVANWSRDFKIIYSNKLENTPGLNPEDKEMLDSLVQ